MKKLLLFTTLFFIASSVFSQSADFITRLLEKDKVTFGEVCYLCAVCQNLVPDDATEVDATNAIFEEGLLPKNVQPSDFANYKNTSALFAKLWNLNGGLFFRMTDGNGRYAFKQFKNDGVINQNSDPSMIPSGVDILNMYTIGEKRYGSTNSNSIESVEEGDNR